MLFSFVKKVLKVDFKAIKFYNIIGREITFRKTMEENMNDVVFYIMLVVVGLFVCATVVIIYNKFKVSA